MLKLKQLKRVYHSDNATPVTAVNNAELHVAQGNFVSIIGRSGCGKSTMLNMIVGLLKPTSGKVLIKDIDLWSMKESHMAKIRNSQMGYIPQGYSLLSNLNVLDNVRLPYCLSKKKGSGIEPAMRLLEEIGIKALAERYPAQLSGGEMRKAAIARALINSPEILIADEPTSDLDEESTKEVIKLISKFHSKGLTILMVTHQYEVARYANRLWRMSSGDLVELNINKKVQVTNS